MAGRYYNISREEIESFLSEKRFTQIQGLKNTYELVYGKRVDVGNRKMTLRIYTGINPNGQSRKKGADAIRVMIIERMQDGTDKIPYFGNKVKRVTNWQSNLSRAIAHAMVFVKALEGKHEY